MKILRKWRQPLCIAVIPLIGFLILQRIYFNTPQAAQNAVLAALTNKDERRLRYWTTARGLQELKEVAKGKSWQDQWQE